MDAARVRALVAALPAVSCTADTSVGAVLGAALLTSALGRRVSASDRAAPLEPAAEAAEVAQTPRGGRDASTVRATSSTAAASIDILRVAAKEADEACATLGVPGAIRLAACEPLALTGRLLQPLAVQSTHRIFATAASVAPVAANSDGGLAMSLSRFDGWRRGGAKQPPSDAQVAGGWGRQRPLQRAASDDERACEFASLLRTWELLKLDPNLASQRRLDVGPRYVVGLLEALGEAEVAEAISDELAILAPAQNPIAGPAIAGAAITGLEPPVPPPLRSQLISSLHVLCRLRGQSPELRTAEQLRGYLDECGLLAQLEAAWSAGAA